MKNVAIITSLDGVGGTEKSLINLLKALPNDAFNVELLLLGKEGPLVKEVPDWINVRFIDSNSSKDYVTKAIKHFHLVKALYGLIMHITLRIMWRLKKTNTMSQYKKSLYLFNKVDEEYDASITWYVPNSIHTVYALKKVKAQKKAIWIHMDVQKDKMPPDAIDAFSKYDRIYCVSNACRDGFIEKYHSCSDITETYYNLIDKNEIRHLGRQDISIVLNKGIKLATCGRLAYEKQPLLSIEIVKKLISDGFTDFVWYFVGDGPQRQQFTDEIKKNHLGNYIVLLGNQLNPYAYVSKADLYVQMSIHESFCLTLAEAQILGIPAVSTNFKSAYEIIDNGKSGVIVENHIDNIYTAIKEFLKDKQQLNNFKINVNDYDLKSIGTVDKLISYLDVKGD